MLRLYRQLFQALNESAIDHCVWKNYNELPQALAGRGDIDLYVPPRSRADFQRVLLEAGFIRLEALYAYPSVEHYYGYDRTSGLLCHLHCYFQIVTGESHLKQYVLPIERYLHALPSHQSEQGPRLMHPELMYKLGLFRRSIKLSCLAGAFLYVRDRDGYALERTQLHSAAQTSAPTGVTHSGWMSVIEPANSLLQECLLGFRYRRHCRSMSRYGVCEGVIKRYWHLLVRPLNKLRGRRKRLRHGVIIALVGLDGAGKTSSVEMLCRWLSPHMQVRAVHYGHGRKMLATLPIRWALSLRQMLRRQEPVAGESVSERIAKQETASLVAHLRYLALAYERRAALTSALRAACRGQVVITDRWYSQNLGKMDSARLNPEKVTGISRWMARQENRLYESSPDPDLLLRFRVDEQLAVERNRARQKVGKETDEQIASRFALHDNLDYRCEKQLEIENNGTLDALHDRLKQSVWSLLCDAQP